MTDQDIKTIIVQAASLYFSKYGFHKTTMDEIARHIHKAKGVLYYYFKNKEELFNEVLKHELNAVKIELSKITDENADSLTMINNYFLTRLKLMSQAVNYHETLKADFFEKYHFVKDVRDDFAKFEYEQIKKIFDKGLKEGYIEIKNQEKSVDAVLMLLNSIEIPLYLQNKYDEYEGTIAEIVNMVINSLRAYKK